MTAPFNSSLTSCFIKIELALGLIKRMKLLLPKLGKITFVSVKVLKRYVKALTLSLFELVLTR
jgi:hypothetical protein